MWFPIRDLKGHRRETGEEVGVAVNNAFPVGMEKPCPSGGLLKPSHLLGAGC